MIERRNWFHPVSLEEKGYTVIFCMGTGQDLVQFEDSRITQWKSAGVTTLRTWVWIPAMMGDCCEYEHCALMLAQNNSLPHHEVER